MTKPHFTHIVALLDKSGSMGKVRNDTIGGFNTFVEEQKKVPGEATLTLVQFSDKCETTFSDVPLAHVAPLNTDTYKIGGSTALNDALAKTVNDVGIKLAAKPENERPSKVVVLVMTDGEENKSILFHGAEGLRKLNGMVTHQKEAYSWEFVFVGANIDSFSTANHYGIGAGQTINYTSDSFGQQNVFKSLSRGMAAQRTAAFVGAAAPLNFFENERSRDIVSNASLDTLDINATINKYLNKDALVTVDLVSGDAPKQSTTTQDTNSKLTS